MIKKNVKTAVVLAGGLGTRLRPYTVSLPKPLMPVGDHPILEIVVMQLRASGIERIIIAVGYLAPLIRAYFGDGSKYGLKIFYSSEDEPLGTAGPLALLKDEIDETFIFMNGDVFTDLNFAKMTSCHYENDSLVTVGLSSRKINIDFGVIDFDKNGEFKGWKEKPTIKYDVSMGVYVLEPEILDFLPRGFSNIPDVVQSVYNARGSLNCYHHNGYWLDIGRPTDYEEACKDFAEKGLDYWLTSQ